MSPAPAPKPIAPPLRLKGPRAPLPLRPSVTLLEAQTLAYRDCANCGGSGHNPLGERISRSTRSKLRIEARGAMVCHPCKCVAREIFRRCLDRYRTLQEQFEGQPRFRTGTDYCIDFELIARRTLSERNQRIYEDYYLWRIPAPGCALRAKLERGSLDHAIYRIAELLGGAFAGTKPYGLFPLRAYFQPSSK